MLSANIAIIEPRQPVPGSTANNDIHASLNTASNEPYRVHPQQATPLHNGTVWPHTEQSWSCGARHQEHNWIHRPWTQDANLTSWDSTTRPPIACIFGAKKFWFYSCGRQHIYISLCVTVCHYVSLCHHLSLCIMFRLCLDDI